MGDWTIRSAAWQVGHGGPTERTYSAAEYLASILRNEVDEGSPDERGQAGLAVLDQLMEQRGLA